MRSWSFSFKLGFSRIQIHFHTCANPTSIPLSPAKPPTSLFLRGAVPQNRPEPRSLWSARNSGMWWNVNIKLRGCCICLVLFSDEWSKCVKMFQASLWNIEPHSWTSLRAFLGESLFQAEDRGNCVHHCSVLWKFHRDLYTLKTFNALYNILEHCLISSPTFQAKVKGHITERWLAQWTSYHYIFQISLCNWRLLPPVSGWPHANTCPLVSDAAKERSVLQKSWRSFKWGSTSKCPPWCSQLLIVLEFPHLEKVDETNATRKGKWNGGGKGAGFNMLFNFV